MSKLFLDAGTTWSKLIEIGNESQLSKDFAQYFIKKEADKSYYIVPSILMKKTQLNYERVTGHMSLASKDQGASYVNEVIALSKGAAKRIKDDNYIILDLGSRDVKWVQFKENKFRDLDWNSSCASATGATVEMLLKFYDIKVDDLQVMPEKYNITCGIFGLEKIMDDIANGETAKIAVSKFIHGIAFNAWTFAKQPSEIYLSGGFCDNQCFVDSLKKYCNVNSLGRFVLCDGLLAEM